MKTSFLLPLLLLGAAGQVEIALAQTPGMFSVMSGMTMPRTLHTATLLPNGKSWLPVAFGKSRLAVSI